MRAIAVHRQTTKSQLSLQLIGFDSPALIYLNEQLTKTNYEMFKHALRIKKQKSVCDAFWWFHGKDIRQKFFEPVQVGSSGVSEADRHLWSEKECSSETTQFLTAPTSESDTKVRSMIVWQALVMNEGTLPLLHKNRFEFRIKSKRESPLLLLFGQPHWV